MSFQNVNISRSTGVKAAITSFVWSPLISFALVGYMCINSHSSCDEGAQGLWIVLTFLLFFVLWLLFTLLFSTLKFLSKLFPLFVITPFLIVAGVMFLGYAKLLNNRNNAPKTVIGYTTLNPKYLPGSMKLKEGGHNTVEGYYVIYTCPDGVSNLTISQDDNQSAPFKSGQGGSEEEEVQVRGVLSFYNYRGGYLLTQIGGRNTSIKASPGCLGSDQKEAMIQIAESL